MSEHCPQDGGFIGDCGCTHPNHEHSELVKNMLAAETPDFITEANGESALSEGFWVPTKDPDGREYSVGFGQRILDHWNDQRPGHQHAPNDIKARKERLGFAVDTVKSYDRTEFDHDGYAGRRMYFKAYKKFGMTVIADPNDNDKIEAFTYIPKRSDKKKGQGGAGHPSTAKVQPTGANSTLSFAPHDTTSAPGAQGGKK